MWGAQSVLARETTPCQSVCSSPFHPLKAASSSRRRETEERVARGMASLRRITDTQMSDRLERRLGRGGTGGAGFG
jgi:hypothetical protein